jgi:hypothetical protein
MKKPAILLLSLGLWYAAPAQVNLTPYAGINTTRIYSGFLYENGGAFAVTGLELELAKKPKQTRPLQLSMTLGASYLSNGFYYSGNFSYTALNFYTQRITDLKTQYVQFPLLLRVN